MLDDPTLNAEESDMRLLAGMPSLSMPSELGTLRIDDDRLSGCSLPLVVELSFDAFLRV